MPPRANAARGTERCDRLISGSAESQHLHFEGDLYLCMVMDTYFLTLRAMRVARCEAAGDSTARPAGPFLTRDVSYLIHTFPREHLSLPAGRGRGGGGFDLL